MRPNVGAVVGIVIGCLALVGGAGFVYFQIKRRFRYGSKKVLSRSLSVSLAFSVALSVSLSVPVSALVLVVLSRAEPNVFEAATLRRSPMACDASASAS